VSPTSPVFGPKGPTALTSSQRTPLCLCRALGLRLNQRCLAFTALRCCPPSTEREGLQQPLSFRSSITRPWHWLFTLRAAIADDDAKLASGGWPSFPGWDSNLPTEFFREVSAFWAFLSPELTCRYPLPPVLMFPIQNPKSKFQNGIKPCDLHQAFMASPKARNSRPHIGL